MIRSETSSKADLGFTQMVGHSMGGSVVARATPKLQALNYAVGGVAVLDAVEGSSVLGALDLGLSY